VLAPQLLSSLLSQMLFQPSELMQLNHDYSPLLPL
jgi:hypothetical protein